MLINELDRRAISIIRHTQKNTEDNRAEVAPLWKGEARPKPNYSSAKKNWESTRAMLDREDVLKEYLEVIKGWEQDHLVEEVPPPEEEKGFYLPHFPVIRRDKETTKARIVANGKAAFHGLSLNDCMMSGPKVINSLVQVLMKFRAHRCAVMVDVANMFLRVRMPAADRAYHRFVFSDESGAIHHRQFIGHIFGSAGSLCVAVAVLKLAALKFHSSRPKAAEAILDKSVVDDVLASYPEESEMAEACEGLKEICASIGMKLHKWSSNFPDWLPPGAHRVSEVEIVDKQSEGCAGNEDDVNVEGNFYKPLGLGWETAADELSFNYKVKHEPPYTKLTLLKLYMSVFDPLGLLIPFIMSARILYRDLRREGVDWEEEVSATMEDEWKKWISQLVLLDEFRFPRSVDLDRERDQLAVFTDASSDGYGAVAYLFNNERARIIYARACVNSDPARTIPMLELLGAELGVVTAREVARALEFALHEVAFFSDSQTVLNWIRNPARDVSHHIARKLGQIRDAVPAENWNFVPTADNPADAVSRGCKLEQLLNSDLWCEGPEFLKSKEKWPDHGIPSAERRSLQEEDQLSRLVGIFCINRTRTERVPLRGEQLLEPRMRGRLDRREDHTQVERAHVPPARPVVRGRGPGQLEGRGAHGAARAVAQRMRGAAQARLPARQARLDQVGCQMDRWDDRDGRTCSKPGDPCPRKEFAPRKALAGVCALRSPAPRRRPQDLAGRGEKENLGLRRHHASTQDHPGLRHLRPQPSHSFQSPASPFALVPDGGGRPANGIFPRAGR